MKRIAAVTLALLIGVAGATPALATGGTAGQVCEPLDSGKIDVVGSHKTVTVTADEGFLITGYCVKAGSAKQGLGPSYVTLDTPVTTLTFGHWTGKDVSHYSIGYIESSGEEVPVTDLAVPTLIEQCGYAGDGVVLPADTDQVDYELVAAGVPQADGMLGWSVVALPAVGYVVPGGQGYEVQPSEVAGHGSNQGVWWGYTFAVACDDNT